MRTEFGEASTALHAAIKGWTPRPGELPVTRVRLRGAWVTTRNPRTKLHRVERGFAAWGSKRTYFAAKALCGLATNTPRFFIEPPEIDLCDDCVFVDDSREVVYRFFDDDGALLYIGYSGAFHRRLDEHRHSSLWWPKVRACTYETHADEATARAVEFAAIEVEKPRHNRRSGPVPRQEEAA